MSLRILRRHHKPYRMPGVTGKFVENVVPVNKLRQTDQQRSRSPHRSQCHPDTSNTVESQPSALIFATKASCEKSSATAVVGCRSVRGRKITGERAAGDKRRRVRRHCNGIRSIDIAAPQIRRVRKHRVDDQRLRRIVIAHFKARLVPAANHVIRRNDRLLPPISW